ncbi:MAG: DNA primase small subunit domain-containing protein [Conexivisphaerales archaeon]
METQRIKALKEAFRWYYFNRKDELVPPTEIEKREFGYRDFNGLMIRHIQLKTQGELSALALKVVPRSIYYSVSYYSDPTAPMEEKGRLGSDLVFDIDLKDVSKSYTKYSFWVCSVCHAVGPGPAPNSCPQCASKQTREIVWACRECINEVRQAAVSLGEMLQNDFGLSASEISTYFSGNNGFHLHVDSKKFYTLSARERGEISDYIRGTGFVSKIYLLNVPEQAKRTISERKHISIDPQVTIDVSRIFRLPGSLHDESGLEKKLCKHIESCDPLTDAIGLQEDPFSLRVYYSPEFTLNEKKFGPYKMEDVKLPTYAAVYLMAKDLADPFLKGYNFL